MVHWRIATVFNADDRVRCVQWSRSRCDQPVEVYEQSVGVVLEVVSQYQGTARHSAIAFWHGRVSVLMVVWRYADELRLYPSLRWYGVFAGTRVFPGLVRVHSCCLLSFVHSYGLSSSFLSSSFLSSYFRSFFLSSSLLSPIQSSPIQT